MHKAGYDVTNWYWVVAGDTTKVFSSAAGDYVTNNDPTFQAWVLDGGVATRIDTELNLGGVLADAEVRPTAAGVLDGYQRQSAQRILVAAYFKILFNHENRLRAIERALGLNGSPANLTPAQAFNAIKSLL